MAETLPLQPQGRGKEVWLCSPDMVELGDIDATEALDSSVTVSEQGKPHLSCE